MGALVYVEGTMGGETVQEPEGTVADGKGVGEEACVERWGWESVDVEGRYRTRQGGVFCRGGWIRRGFRGDLGGLLGLDVVDDVDDVSGV